MKSATPAYLPIMLIFLTACPYGYKYNIGTLPTTPVNLEEFNSEYDDYNSTSGMLGGRLAFCFSTNRNSNGERFDIIQQHMSIAYSQKTGELTIFNNSAWTTDPNYDFFRDGLLQINTPGNDLGPYLIHNPLVNYGNYYAPYEYEYLLMYATDEQGNFDIQYSYNVPDSSFIDTKPVPILNSSFNDLYPTLNKDYSQIFFCSDRERSNFDIYSVTIDTTEIGITGVLENNPAGEVVFNNILSSPYDDKCPFIMGNIMVFASNRPGGYGGYDLYYSLWADGQWGIPVNYGENINTVNDEYRPILIEEGVSSTQTMMVFSSDRPGGMGGFDLYYVGINYTP